MVCRNCGTYTYKDKCEKCGSTALSPDSAYDNYDPDAKFASSSAPHNAGVIIGLFLGLIGLLIGVLIFNKEDERKQFISSWLPSFIIQVVFAVILVGLVVLL